MYYANELGWPYVLQCLRRFAAETPGAAQC